MTKFTLAVLTTLLSIGGAANAQTGFGTITGLVTDSQGSPVSGATLTAVRQGGGTVRSTISKGGGLYSLEDLPPGNWAVKVRTATSSEVAKVELNVVPEDAVRADIVLRVVTAAAAPVPVPSPVTRPAGSSFPVAGRQGTDSLWSRWLHGDAWGWKDLDAKYPRQGSRQEHTEIASLGGLPVTALGGGIPDDQASGAFPAASSPVPAPATPAAADPAAAPAVDTQTPFGDADWTWLNGNSRQHDSPLDTKYFTPEFRADSFFGIDFNQPKDHSMGGSSEVFRNGEFQLEDLSLGGDFHAGNMRGRVLMLFGMFSATTVRNDASPAVGQWDVRSAYKYVSEAYGGYHFNVQHGINVDAGIFVSYVGLFSYHNFDNWAYQPSYVSSNTPWFFNGLRIQWFPTNHLKIEPWIINGWQSYNKFNGHLGVGGQVKWTPKPWLDVIGNQYAVGNDNVGLPNRGRYHTDDSVEVKYYDHPQAGNGIDRMAFTFTADAGCETGDGVTCHGGKGGPKQAFLGYMAYNRWWWHKDLFAVTLGGGQITNPGRYLTLVLPINGADAISGTPYFAATPGSTFKAYDGTATFDWMPSQFFTFRTEIGYRHSNVPYWSGRGGITPPGGNNGAPADYACSNGSSSGQTSLSAAQTACGGAGNVWFPDLRKGQSLLSFSIMVKL